LATRDMVTIEGSRVQCALAFGSLSFYLWIVYHLAMSVGNTITGRSLLSALPAYFFLAWLKAARYYVAKGSSHNRRSRVGLLYDKYLGIRGSYYVWKVLVVQTTHVVLQAYTKLPMFARISTSGYKTEGGTIMLQGCHAVFLFALVVNVLYPPILLRSSSVRFQREVAAMFDVFLDCAYIWPIIVVQVLTFSPTVLQVVAPLDPFAYFSSFWPVLHVFTCSRAVEKAVACRVREEQSFSRKSKGGINVKGTRLPLWTAVCFLIVTVGSVGYFYYVSVKDGLWPFAAQCRNGARDVLGKNNVCGCSQSLKTLYACRHADNLHAIRTFSFHGVGLTSIRDGAFSSSGDPDLLVNTPALLLSLNELTTLNEGTFDGLSSVRVLDLSNNSISSISPGVFAGMAGLELLLLRGNPINCSSVQAQLPAGTTCNDRGYCDSSMCVDSGNDCSLRPSWPGEEHETVPTCASGLTPLIYQNLSHLVEFSCCNLDV